MQEIDTDHQFRPTNIFKNSFTFFVIKNVRIRVTTYLWERDVQLSCGARHALTARHGVMPVVCCKAGYRRAH